jgi:hypothetical protein
MLAPAAFPDAAFPPQAEFTRAERQAGVRGDCMTEDDLQKDIAALEYAAARRGLYLTVHALNKVKEVLKWELAGDREKALEAQKERGRKGSHS